MDVKGICKTVADKKKGIALLTAVGGLHLMTTESQPVLGRIDVLSSGRYSIQHGLGLILTVTGVCCLVSCM